MKFILPFGVVLLGLVCSGATDAQTLQVPRVEVGVEGGLLGAFGEGLYRTPTAGPRLTFNISQNDAVELTAQTQSFAGSSFIYGLYLVQYKRTAKHPSDWRIRPFYTAGTGGYFNYRRIPEYRNTRLDGAVVVYPSYSTGELSGFNMLAFGGGFERSLNRHASFRLEGSGLTAFSDYGFLGFRVLAGVSLPIGGYRANASR